MEKHLLSVFIKSEWAAADTWLSRHFTIRNTERCKHLILHNNSKCFEKKKAMFRDVISTSI